MTNRMGTWEGGASVDSDPRRRFAEELKSARELYPERRLTQTDTARLARTSKSTVSRLESGEGPIPPELPAVLDQIFKTDGLFKQLYEEAVAQSFPAMHRRRMKLERKAIAIWEWSQHVVPGLLQTSDYARAILCKGDPRASEAEITKAVRARLTRQDILRGAAPPEVRVVLCESVLHRHLGHRDVMRGQLSALLTHMEHPTIGIRVLPLDAEAHLMITSSASFLTAPSHMTVVCVEAYRSSEIIEDLEHVRAAQRAFEDLMGEALPARRSADLIRQQMEKLT
ncbi:helix-turn-helix transcriptional regulator [Streptomyces sp. NBC_00091]|uniref:helix-turn-helix domain-containing protein n=1 Tax=Streptomyces sp. NBC_00091 TaxID=2975648 RepID=UPI00224DE810|nr:helix-turn-helix transcriptional regulator [Streptomyces sp. NBC_00091]MCX5378709.1 helix-turn-helix domain-containing protein [Streptomyces sp. NBC_00091]